MSEIGNTRVKVEFFKDTGKFYTSFEYRSFLPVFEITEIKDEVEKKGEFIKGMAYTIEVCYFNKDSSWNKYLFTEDYKPKKTKMAEEEKQVTIQEKQVTMTITEDHQDIELIGEFEGEESFQLAEGKGINFNIKFDVGTKVCFKCPKTGKLFSIICRIKS